jgi:hypothetical protein
MSQYPYDTPLRANEPVAPAANSYASASCRHTTSQTTRDRQAFARFVARALVDAFGRGVYIPSRRLRWTIALIWRLQGRIS